jgi:hypothetical protein
LNLDRVFPISGKKIASMTAIGLLVLSALIPTMLTANATTPPALGGTYHKVDGVLGTDTYTLYPWDESSINIGFSKYGEIINPEDAVGLKYKNVDAFASSVVPQTQWNNGWLMDIHWVDDGCLKNIWAYALYSDWVTAGGVWQQGQQSYDGSATGDTHGGRRTNGYVTSDPIEVVYDGPRKAIYLLKTHIYDKAPGEAGGCELVQLTIQLVFDKVQKDLMEIKDIKRICGPDKVVGPLQIEFSQRAEWDLGDSALSNSKTYAEFYNNLETKYDEHPFYSSDVTYDLCQMLNPVSNKVGYAAFWPQLTAKWVDGTLYIPKVDVFGTPDRLTSTSTYNHDVTVPSDPQTNHPWVKFFKYDGDETEKTTIFLPYEPVEYPTGAGEMTDVPWVFVWDSTNQCWQWLQEGNDWLWIDVCDHKLPDGITVNWAVQLQYPMPLTYGKDYLVLYKMEAMGKEEHTNIAPLECTSPDIFANGQYSPSYGMYQEPGTPFVIGEWDFDLSFDHVENSTHQFRCVSVYGLTDLNNAVDPDQHIKVGETDVDGFRIDSEVQYQLAKTFNPIDLKEAAEDDTFRWCQKGDLTTTITLTAHKTDKYDNVYENCTLQSLWIPSKWGAYCNDSEKVLLIDAQGAKAPLLLTRGTQYTIGAAPWTINLNTAKIPNYSNYDYYKVLYTTKITQETMHEGRYEWIVVGETSHASDSIGSDMLTIGFSEWKDVEVWISALDIESETYGPSMPRVLRRYATMTHNRLDYQYDNAGGDYRYAFRDDWSTPEDWDMQETINPYAVSSASLIVVGGPINNGAAGYWNDFTDALVFTNYGTGYYAPGCWARTSQPTLEALKLRGTPMDELQFDDLWYNSATTDDKYGYSIVSVYKDLNETVGLVVYGYTAEDTYYTCYALRGGLLEWLQTLDEGVTTVVLEIDYSSLHPVTFHVKECLGPFTESTGFDTCFKTGAYEQNNAGATSYVTDAALNRGICYKLVEIAWCSQVHPDP